MTESAGCSGGGAGLDRRMFLKGAGAVPFLAFPSALPAAAAVPTRARIVVAGGGAAGLAAASRLSRLLEGARITVIEPSRLHIYQPGLTLVACGVWKPARVVDNTAAFMPRDVEWIEESVVAFEPDSSRIVTSGGRTVPYDFLIVATGCILDYEKIGGMSQSLVGREGIASVYAGPEGAAATWRAMQAFAEAGGTGLFGRPVTDIKCAGAPLKIAFLTDDLMRRMGTRSKARLQYRAHNDAVFSVPVVAARTEQLFRERQIEVAYNHVLVAIDPGRREATYRTPDGTEVRRYDFLHVVPDMSPVAPLVNSPLAWAAGPFAGWLEVDPATLRHRRYPNVFGIGDVNGVPKGKTAASVKWQAPVATANLAGVISGKEPTEIYNGYTSCPLVTGVGRAMLVEFDYENRLTPSFPFIDPLTEHWSAWVIEEFFLKPTYQAMMRGRA